MAYNFYAHPGLGVALASTPLDYDGIEGPAPLVSGSYHITYGAFANTVPVTVPDYAWDIAAGYQRIIDSGTATEPEFVSMYISMHIFVQAWGAANGGAGGGFVITDANAGEAQRFHWEPTLDFDGSGPYTSPATPPAQGEAFGGPLMRENRTIRHYYDPTNDATPDLFTPAEVLAMPPLGLSFTNANDIVEATVQGPDSDGLGIVYLFWEPTGAPPATGFMCIV